MIHADNDSTIKIRLFRNPSTLKKGLGVRISIINYFSSDSMFPPLKPGIRLKFFRDLAMSLGNSSSGDIEP